LAHHGFEVSELITYEYPLHERSRTLLRLSHSFNQFDFHVTGDSTWETRAAMTAMIDISAILARADIKSDLIKEMERQAVSLGKMRLTKGVDTSRLEQVLLDLNTCITNLHNVDGQLGKQIRDHEFLKGIASRSSLPGGSCDFDLPLYFHWLRKPLESRQSELSQWIATVQPLREAVELLLSLIRGSNTARSEIAQNGIFNKSLDGNVIIQMIRITLPHEANLYPEVSGSKHRFNIRFMETMQLDHPQQTSSHVNFKLTTCVI
jgi:cell division protein ZapD